jgi:mannose/fructose-specific phosphotransferase system component IIA
MVVGIVVTHGRLAEELIETAKVVFGEFSGCYGVTNRGKSPQLLLEEIEELIDVQNGEPCIVFVDFFGGSCGYACMKLRIKRENVPVITGINLPMLLAFLNKRDMIPFEGLPAKILSRGHDSLRSVDPDEM